MMADLDEEVAELFLMEEEVPLTYPEVSTGFTLPASRCSSAKADGWGYTFVSDVTASVSPSLFSPHLTLAGPFPPGR